MIVWIQKLACLFLYRTRASVTINIDCDSDLNFRQRNQYMYGCNVRGRVIFRGKVVPIPEGKYIRSLVIEELQDI